MQKLEALQCKIALYPKMGYYNIRLPPTSEYMTTIVTKFGKFIYNRLPMGMCAFGYIFQAKVDKILGDIEGFKMYTDGILVLSKDGFEKHID